MEQAAYERRVHARLLLFGKAGGRLKNLSETEKRFVRMVWQEAYNAYLHLYRTGESRFHAWPKQERKACQRIEPMNQRMHYNQWWRSNKARYNRTELRSKDE